MNTRRHGAAGYYDNFESVLIPMATKNGGARIAEVLRTHGVPFLFTLCGGHIAPILVECKKRDIRVIDTRHEATAVYAADAVSRLTGIPGVAAVTAGPGVTNTITAVKNAQMAQSPVVLIGGAAPTALKGRGALQDIDQMALVKSAVKWSKAVRRLKDLAPALEQAFFRARSGVPGPVFIECPIDLLYDEAMIRDWYGAARSGRGLANKAVDLYLHRHVNRIFAGADIVQPTKKYVEVRSDMDLPKLDMAAEQLAKAERPVVLAGSQVVLDPRRLADNVAAIERIGAPVYLSGMARGLLGRDHALHIRHKRQEALRQADLVILAGVPCDFRLDYGRHIPGRTFLISANRSRRDVRRNRRPSIGLHTDPGLFLRALASRVERITGDRENWIGDLAARDAARDEEIADQAQVPAEPINPVQLCLDIENALDDKSIIIADGGDFVGTASYIVKPRGPLSWLDPGAFGTLGVGAGFALGAKLCRPDAEVWLLYGDGSAGYSIAEFDTFVRHNIPVIAVVGNDAGWSQIAREQVDILKDDVGTVLARTDYHHVAAGFGGAGFLLNGGDAKNRPFEAAKAAAAAGKPALVNAHIGRTDFRKGSISM